MYPRSDTWLMEELRLDPIFQLLIVNSDFPPSSVSHSKSQHHHLPIFYQARNLEVLLAGLSSPLFTFCHDHILVILPVTSFTNVFFLIHSHIHSPALCPYQCSTRLQESSYWPSCFLSFPSTVQSLARLLLKF